MAVSLSIIQQNGVTTTYNRIKDIRYQPKISINISLSSYLDQATRESGGAPVLDQYVFLDISRIDPSLPLLEQCYNQLSEPDAILDGGKPV